MKDKGMRMESNVNRKLRILPRFDAAEAVRKAQKDAGLPDFSSMSIEEITDGVGEMIDEMQHVRATCLHEWGPLTWLFPNGVRANVSDAEGCSLCGDTRPT